MKVKSQAEFDRMANIESDLKTTDQELKKIKTEAENKLKELNKNAEKADAKQKKKLQAEAKKIVDDYNKKATYLEKKTGLQLSHMNPTEVQRLAKIGVVDNLMKFNGKVDKFMNRKVSRFMI
jgi:Skp family chaperone for outer membrane proteins